MRLSTAVVAAFGALGLSEAQSQSSSFWLRVVGGNELVDNKLLRNNNTYSLGVSLPPYNPSDHFSRLTIFSAPDISSAPNITVVPTNPHPGPIAGHLALNGTAPSSSTSFKFKLFETWHPDTEPGEIHLDNWSSTQDDGGKTWLRYDGQGEGLGGQGRWVAIKGETPFYRQEFWSPWWVGPDADLAGEEWVEVDVEVVAAQDGVNSRRRRRSSRME
jgi:hypothetical protein